MKMTKDYYHKKAVLLGFIVLQNKESHKSRQVSKAWMDTPERQGKGGEGRYSTGLTETLMTFFALRLVEASVLISQYLLRHFYLLQDIKSKLIASKRNRREL